MGRRSERVGNLIRQTIGELLLSKLSDPRLDPAITSVTHVEMTDDLLGAKVYVSVMGDGADQRKTLRALQHAAGHIQKLMMRQIRLRNTPVLDFVLDTWEVESDLDTWAVESALDVWAVEFVMTTEV